MYCILRLYDINLALRAQHYKEQQPWRATGCLGSSTNRWIWSLSRPVLIDWSVSPVSCFCSIKHQTHNIHVVRKIWLKSRLFCFSDRGSVRPRGGHGALHGFPAFALAGSFSVTQSEEQQSRRGQCSCRAPPASSWQAPIYYRSSRLAPQESPRSWFLINHSKIRQVLQKNHPYSR